MLANAFSAETRISNQLRRYLLKRKHDIAQLITPGAQAPYSITYKNDKNVNTTVYPDLISWNSRFAYIGEMKPRFSNKDKDKLQRLYSSVSANNHIRKMLQRCGCLNHTSIQIKFVLVYSGKPRVGLLPLYQLVFSKDTFDEYLQ